jgi:uncharacterized protein YeaO (DUF488 family)
MIEIERIYNKPKKSKAFRILVDRLWPRGVSTEKAKLDLWLKEIAPSEGLRKWFSHDPAKWAEFKRRYFAELSKKEVQTNLLAEKTKEGDVVLLYGAKTDEFNNAVALKEYLEKNLKA